MLREKKSRDFFSLRAFFSKGKKLLRENFCLRANFAKGKIFLREKNAKGNCFQGIFSLKDKFG